MLCSPYSSMHTDGAIVIINSNYPLMSPVQFSLHLLLFSQKFTVLSIHIALIFAIEADWM